MPTLLIFEDDQATSFHPLTLTRPVFELRCGMTTLRGKIERAFPGRATALCCREYLATSLRRRAEDCVVNNVSALADDCLVVNGRALLEGPLELALGESLVEGEALVAARVSASIVARLGADGPLLAADLRAAAPETRKVSGLLMNHHWDLIARLADCISSDFATMPFAVTRGAQLPVGSHLVGSRGDLFIEESATVLPGVVFDVSDGPIYVGRGATIRPPTFIQGPACIGEGCAVDGAQLRAGACLGPRCGVGGEVSASVFLEGANKRHAGFVGHSYLGAYVNCGALTTTSNLKNNNSPVRVQLAAGASAVDTGHLFVGSCLGDHSLLGIGTLLTTGAVIGAGCNVFGGGVSPAYIPSFAWGGNDGFVEHRLERMMETAETVTRRRGGEWDAADRAVLTNVFAMTADDRAAFLSYGSVGQSRSRCQATK